MVGVLLLLTSSRDAVDDFEGLEDEEDEGDISYVRSGSATHRASVPRLTPGAFGSMGGENEDDDVFDMTIGALEEIMMGKASDRSDLCQPPPVNLTLQLPHSLTITLLATRRGVPTDAEWLCRAALLLLR